ncbi:AraC family transcriptional regulator [Lacrimispora sp. 38-1]|uniref:helix-turn-helix transcriptional regulator n=1 Tax=Lacrimispora sp. 38-1 TaxID=3125778 RepID=UPI003CF6E1F4
MSFCELVKEGFWRLIKNASKEFEFKMHGSFRYSVYPGWKSTLQNYNDLHILYVRGGEGCYHMHDGTDIQLTRGTLVFISHGVEHHASVNIQNPLQIVGLRFGIYDCNGLNVTKELTDSFYYYMYPKNLMYYDELFRKLHQLYNKEEGAVTEKISSSYLYQLLYDFYEILDRYSDKKSTDSRIEKVRHIIEDHPFEKISIPMVANEIGISTRYLQKKFKENYSLSPKEYHLKQQMDLALILLGQENLPVTEVAERLGYSDMFSFSKQFKKHFGYPPLQAKTVNNSRGG